jgi:SAM-dependent methyltransferase
MTQVDPFGQLKAAQREGWSLFAPMETGTTIPAGELVRFAGIAAGERVLDVGSGTGVVAVTAAKAGARVDGLDLTPALVERARQNSALADVPVSFVEGDVEALPYPEMVAPALSPEHVRAAMESTIGPLARLMDALRSEPDRLETLRAEILTLVREYWRDNQMRQVFLMSRAIKRA